MTTTHFVWDEPTDNIHMLVQGGAFVRFTNAPKLEQLEGEGTEWVCQHRESETSSEFFCTDGQGSTRDVLDGAGVPTTTYELDAFGNRIAVTGPDITPLVYRQAEGAYSEYALGIVMTSRRILKPVDGRLMSPSPILGEYAFRANISFAKPQVNRLGVKAVAQGCSCGSFRVTWQYSATPANNTGPDPLSCFLIQEVCEYELAVPCDVACETCSEDRTRARSSDFCIIELLGSVSPVLDGSFRPDNWQNGDIGGGTEKCRSRGIRLSTASVRMICDKRIETVPPWIKTGSITLPNGRTIQVGPYLLTPWYYWHRWRQEPWWTQSASVFLLHTWNCCPVSNDDYGQIAYGWVGQHYGRIGSAIPVTLRAEPCGANLQS